jgi:hypothetical protein
MIKLLYLCPDIKTVRFYLMSKILKKIAVFWLWLAGLILCAHLLIPHDHHSSDGSLNQDENCPVSNKESGHHSGFPLHCHAFNDLASEKYRVYQISNNVGDNLIAFHSLSGTSIFKLPVTCLRIINLQKPFSGPYALESSLLRAPPSFV